MLEPAATKIGMPMEEFIRLYDTEGPFEFIDGERKPIMPQVAGHGEVSLTVYHGLYAVTAANHLGVVLHEQTFVLSYTSNWVTGSRQPDVMFYTAERINAYKEANPDWKLKPYVLVPDLVVEVMSPNDDPDELDEKIDLYLADGVRMAWVMNPQRIKVSVYIPTPNTPRTKQQTNLFSGDTLTGGDLLTGFEMPVAKIFE